MPVLTVWAPWYICCAWPNVELQAGRGGGGLDLFIGGAGAGLLCIGAAAGRVDPADGSFLIHELSTGGGGA